MTKQYITHITQSALFAIAASLAVVGLAIGGHLVAEPQISHGQLASTTSFTISQTITGEATFLVNPADVTMDGNLNGITGGYATGSTEFVVQSNTSGGHYVTISFEDNPGQYAMYGESTGSEDIQDFNFGATEPVFGFTPEANATFGYTVTSTPAGDTDDSFAFSGTDCSLTVSAANGSCWMTPTSSEFRIVDRSTPADSATSSVIFQVSVPSGMLTPPSAETYTATATLSLYTQ